MAEEAFLPLIEAQASASLEREAQCLVFDVCQDPKDPRRIVLYEVYETPEASKAKRSPVRPSPHWISSKMSNAPVRLQAARTPLKKSGVARLTPPSPCTGSTMTAHTWSVMAASVLLLMALIS